MVIEPNPRAPARASLLDEIKKVLKGRVPLRDGELAVLEVGADRVVFGVGSKWLKSQIEARCDGDLLRCVKCIHPTVTRIEIRMVP